MNRLAAYVRLIRLHRPIGILLLLWPTLWGIWFAARGMPPLFILLVFVVGTALMRSAGCAINDWADRHFDAQVARTRDRPLVRGELAPVEALGIAAVLSVLAALCLLCLPLVAWFAAVPAAIIAASYPFFKRFFPLPQAYLGIAFSMGIPMAFLALQHVLPPLVWVLMCANLFWCVAYDTEYAMVDREDDVRLGLKTAAILFGRFDVLAVMLCYALALLCLVLVGMLAGRGMFFFAGCGLAGVISIYHFHLIRTRSRELCFRAFRHNNWWGAAVFVGLSLDYFYG